MPDARSAHPQPAEAERERALHEVLAAASMLLDSQLNVVRQLHACDVLSDQATTALIAGYDQLNASVIDRLTGLSGILTSSQSLPDRD